MSGFQKRVALVEKWHTDLTKSLDDMYDLAEQVLDVWQEAEAHTEERIIKLLEEQCEWLMQNNWAANHIKAANFKEAIALIKGETNG